jgi:hypothetical protein
LSALERTLTNYTGTADRLVQRVPDEHHPQHRGVGREPDHHPVRLRPEHRDRAA